jgi:hypothetical protein
MIIAFLAFENPHLLGENATHPIARLPGRLATLLLLAGQRACVVVAPYQPTRQTHTRMRPTMVSRMMGFMGGASGRSLPRLE